MRIVSAKMLSLPRIIGTFWLSTSKLWIPTRNFMKYNYEVFCHKTFVYKKPLKSAVANTLNSLACTLPVYPSYSLLISLHLYPSILLTLYSLAWTLPLYIFYSLLISLYLYPSILLTLYSLVWISTPLSFLFYTD